MAGSLAPVKYWTVCSILCSALHLEAILGSDATSPDALDGAAVEPFEDLRTHAESFQSPEGE